MSLNTAPKTRLNLTRWFDANTPPAREGVYRRRDPAGPYSCWSGDRWYGDARSPALAAAQRKPSPLQGAAWRGVGEPSAEPCWACRGHTVIDHGVDIETGIDLIEECPVC